VLAESGVTDIGGYTPDQNADWTSFQNGGSSSNPGADAVALVNNGTQIDAIIYGNDEDTGLEALLGLSAGILISNGSSGSSSRVTDGQGGASYTNDDWHITASRTPGSTNVVAPPTYTPYTILEIQTPGADGDASQHVDETVETSGIVTAVGSYFYYIQDGAGAWNGVYVYESPGDMVPGDNVTIQGTVTEYNGLTEITGVAGATVNSSGNDLPEATLLGTGAVSAEDYEGVLVTTSGACDNADLGYGEWSIDDGTGSVRTDDVMFEFVPTEGVVYFVTGPVTYSYSNFKILPRDAGDVTSTEASLVTFDIDGLADYDFISVTGTFDGWSGWGAHTDVGMQISVPAGDHEFVILAVDTSIPNWWDDIWGNSTAFYAPIGGDCWNGNVDYPNYVMTVAGFGDPLTISYCAGTCEATCPIPTTDVTFNLLDSYGDGWNGNNLLFGDDVMTIETGSEASFPYSLADGAYTYSYDGAGSYQYENSWTVTLEDGTVLSSGAGADGAADYSFAIGDDIVFGCMDPEALNFNPDATEDDGSCVYELGVLCEYPLDYGAVNGDPQVGATTEAGDADWHSFDVDVDYDNVSISLCGSGFDTKLEVWGACDDAAYLGYNDDYACPGRALQSQVDLTDVAAGTYHAKVYGYGSSFGDYILTITAWDNPTEPALTATSGLGKVVLDWEPVPTRGISSSSQIDLRGTNPIKEQGSDRPSDRDLTGSSVSATADLLDDGTVNCNFTVSIVSPNWAYSDGLEITLPDGITINSAADESGCGTPTVAGQVVTWGGDLDSGWGCISGGETFTINVASYADAFDAGWLLWDDGYGSDPVDVSGTVNVPSATPPPDPPANDLCENAEAVASPYPVAITSSSEGATIDCEGLLDWNAVWYELELPYAVNNVDIVIQADGAISNGGIILMDDCACDDYIIATGYTFDAAGGNINVWFDAVSGADNDGTILFPLFIDSPQGYTVTFDVTEVYVPAYSVYRDGGETPVATGVVGTTYTDEWVSGGVEYCYTVTQTMPDGTESGHSNQACAIPDSAVLNPPSNLTAEEVEGGVSLNWSAPAAAGLVGTFLIEIMTDNYASETTWDLQDGAGNVIETGDPDDNATLHTWEFELDAGEYTWTIYDAYGDGICCAWGEGHYNIYVGDDLIATGGEFEASESVTFNMAGRVMSVSHGSYAEPHGYAKGELPPDLDIPIIIETTEYEQLTREQLTRELLAYNVYRAEDAGEFALLGSVADTTGYLDGTVEYAEYSYYVTAEYSNGESDPTDTASVDLTNYPPTAFTLYSPADGDTIVIDQSNLDSDQAFAWGASTDPNGTAVEYNMCVTVAVPFDQFCEDNGTSTAQFVPLADIADYIDSLNQVAGTGVVLSLNWTVYASDGVNETEASNGPLSVTFDAGWVLGVDEEMGIPDVFALQQNYPNPFNPVTTIRFDVPQESHVQMDVYNILGQRIRTLVNGTMQPGFHSVSWNGTNDMGKPLASGMYIYQIKAEGFVDVKKLVLMK
jgi:hypothetical protein